MPVKTLLIRLYHILTGRYLKIRKSIERNSEWYGNEYGGFFVCPDFLNENSIVYSFGIGEDISFDEEMIKRHNCKVFGFDPTPKSIRWIAGRSIPKNFVFHPYGIAPNTGTMKFFLPENDTHVSGSIVHNSHTSNKTIEVPMKSFEDVVRELKHARIDVLKMDIEGAEYNILPGILKANVEIGQILVEFHHRSIRNGAQLSERAIGLLKEYGFEVFAVTDRSEEVSFIKAR
jgi:FkbM family methyltransferase